MGEAVALTTRFLHRQDSAKTEVFGTHKGSQADIEAFHFDVRFSPKSDQIAALHSRPNCTAW